MAKITPMDLVKSMTGKICEHSDISFAQRGETLYTIKRCNERTTPYSEKELAHQAKFKSVVTAVQERLKDDVQRPADETAFKAQKKYKTLYAYVFAQEWAEYQA